MTDRITEARRAVEQAQARLAALESVPDADNFDPGTVIRWRQEGQPITVVAVKQRNGRWSISDQTQLSTPASEQWAWLQAAHFSHGLDFFEVAPEDWLNAHRKVTPPPIEVDRDDRGRLVIEYQGHRFRWAPAFEAWVKEQ